MTDPTPLERAAIATRELRRARARRILTTLGLWVALPTLLAAILLRFARVAASTSRSRCCAWTRATQLSSARGAASAPVESVAIYAVQEHILSRNVMDKLARKHKLLDHYMSKDVDWWSRLSRKAGMDQAHEYYLGKVSAAWTRRGPR